MPGNFAAALSVAYGDVMVRHFQIDLGSQVVQTDPIRIIEGASLTCQIVLVCVMKILDLRRSEHPEPVEGRSRRLLRQAIGVSSVERSGCLRALIQ
jgi:hypothetical protein